MTTAERHTITLDALFGSRARAELMRAILIDPERAYYQRQLENVTGLPLRAVQRELEKLVALGIVYRWNEGRRAYYRFDTSVPYFDELRAFILKTCTPQQRLRAAIAEQENVRGAIVSRNGVDVLVVTDTGRPSEIEVAEDYALHTMDAASFSAALETAPETLTTFLNGGEDLLGRRDDVIWHWIESAGFEIEKGEEVP